MPDDATKDIRDFSDRLRAAKARHSVPDPIPVSEIVDDIRRRLEGLEAATEGATLSADANLKKAQTRDLDHRIYIRIFAVFLGVVMIGVMLGISYHVVHYLKISSSGWQALLRPQGTLAVAMFVTPLIAATSVCIVIIVGAFRSFRDDETHKAALGAFNEGVNKISGG